MQSTGARMGENGSGDQGKKRERGTQKKGTWEWGEEVGQEAILRGKNNGRSWVVQTHSFASFRFLDPFLLLCRSPRLIRLLLRHHPALPSPPPYH